MSSVFERLYKTPTQSWKNRLNKTGDQRTPSPLRSPSRRSNKPSSGSSRITTATVSTNTPQRSTGRFTTGSTRTPPPQKKTAPPPKLQTSYTTTTSPPQELPPFTPPSKKIPHQQSTTNTAEDDMLDELLESDDDDDETLKVILLSNSDDDSFTRLRGLPVDDYQCGTLTKFQFSKKIIQQLLARESEEDDSSSSMDPPTVSAMKDGMTFHVSQQATYHNSNKVATAEAHIVFLQQEIQIQNYKYYVM